MKKWIAYITYVIIIFAAFLYVLFPSAEIKTFIIQQAEQISPGASVAIGKIVPSFPPGLKFSNLDVSVGNKAVFNASEINITPRYLSLLSAEKSFRLNGIVYNGQLSGDANVKNASSSEYSADIIFDGMQVNEIEALKDLMPHQFSGAAEGRIQYSSEDGVWGNGDAEVTITGCRIEFKPPLFGFKDMALGRVNAVVQLQNRQISIKEILVNGKQVKGNASGTIGLKRPLPRSTVRLNGKIKPHPSLIKELSGIVPSQLLSRRNYVDEGVPFNISGTLDQPNFSLK